MLSLQLLLHDGDNWRRIDNRRWQLLKGHAIAALSLLHNGRSVYGVDGSGGGIGACIGGACSAIAAVTNTNHSTAAVQHSRRRVTLRDGYQSGGGIPIMLQQIIDL